MNCKPGDLAYVVEGASIGAVVQVEKAAPPMKTGDPAWICKSRSPLRCAPRDKWLGDQEATVFRVRDSWLRPISGVPVHDEEHDEVKA